MELFKVRAHSNESSLHDLYSHLPLSHRRYDDGGPNLILCLEAQEYYERHAYKTKVKAAGLLTVSEAKKLAGVASVTVAPALLHTLAETQGTAAEAWRESLFFKDPEKKKETDAAIGGSQQTFLNDETAYREAFARRYAGKGESKTKQVSFLGVFWGLFCEDARCWLTGRKKKKAIAIFYEFQHKDEALMPDNRPVWHDEG